ncbi:MAG: cysteine--tRNA ligase, partial [Gammaproteobacteria bacterium]
LVTRANVAMEAAELGRLKAELLGGGYELGILQQDPEQGFSYAATGAVDVAKVEALIAARAAARAAKNWAEADRLRAELGALGVVIEDGAQGTTWRTA